MGAEDSPTTTTPTNGATDVPSDLELKIIRQIEYYFGDFNLAKDRFLQEQSKTDEGWIPLDIMVKFNRLKELSTDFDVIGAALKKSSSHLMEVSEDGKKIRRNPGKPIPENNDEQKTEITERTVYVKNFPVTTTLDNLLEFFKKYGNVVNIFMKRRRPSKAFKGSVLATFSTKAEAEEFMKLDNVKFNNKELFRETKEEYGKRKNMEYQKKHEEKDRLKSLRASKETETADKDEEEEDQEMEETAKGCILKLNGLSENTMWENIRAVFNPHAQVAYVDYFKGRPEAVVRFEEGTAAIALEKAMVGEEDDKKLIICDTEVTATVLEGEEEQAYWKKFLKIKEERKQRQKGKKGKRGRGRQGRGGRERNEESSATKRSADTSTDEPPSKQMKSENDDEN